MKHKRWGTLWTVLTIIAFVIWGLNIIFMHSFNPWFIATVFFSFIFFCALSGLETSKAQKLSAGLEGEERSVNALSSLPDEYTVIRNVHLDVPEVGKAEIDQLVIGPNGLFVVETKNYRGALYGDLANPILQKTKVSSSGNEYTETVKNPVQQVRRQVWILAQFLRSKGFNFRIKGIVFMTNPDVEMNVTDSRGDVPVVCRSFDGDDALVEEIADSCIANLSESDISRIHDAILNA